MKKAKRTFALIVIAAIAAVTVFVTWQSITRVTPSGLALDDGYIHLVYARNLLQGNVFEFNVGEKSTGTTSPLWVLLLALFGQVFGYVLGAQVLCAISLMFAVLSTFWLSERILKLFEKQSLIVPIICALGIIFYGRFFIHAFTGMETLFFAATCAFVQALFLRAVDDDKSFSIIGLICGLALWIRPEALLFFVIVLAVFAATKKPNFNNWLHFLMAPVILTVAYVVFNYTLTGHFLPGTFYGKTAQFAGSRMDYLKYTASLFLRENIFLCISAIILPIIYFLRTKRTTLLLPLLWICALPVAKFAMSFAEIHFGRYTIVILPTLMALGVSSLFAIFTAQKKYMTILAYCTAALLAGFSARDFLNWTHIAAKCVKQINDIHGDTAKFIAAKYPPHTAIATHDIGRLAFDTKLEIIDIAGLASPEFAQLMWKNRTAFSMRKTFADSLAAQFLIAKQPKLLVIDRSWFPYLAANRAAFAQVFSTQKLTNAVEGIPEFTVFELRDGFESTIFYFERFGFAYDLQSVFVEFFPLVAQLREDLAEKQAGTIAQNSVSEIAIALDEKYPHFEAGLVNIAIELLSIKDFARAQVVAETGTILYARNAIFWNISGAILSNAGDFSHARDFFANAVTLAPQNAAYRQNFATTLDTLGDHGAARAQLDTVELLRSKQ